ncbi:fumarylacetoacetate hydrolase family protein [Pararoseomonas indoligenes]|uniref:Fumarylacetoacetate hydrolase family protein n=1 Tax=Roseomonas indoligenes TaxID=2820811 RepID=A0A940S6T9_9PROT|nr:fumarylacetoacetate hydrolase family protein [Pararoseomonas indoligenes]MBP0495896.1 fumarylacetoacetate hydrolase family protein [Pararoseomonas indoligenes]
MKLAVFDDNRLAVVEGESLYDVTDAVPSHGSVWPPVFMQHVISDWAATAPRLSEARQGAPAIPRNSVTLRSPIPFTGNIVAAPANYTKHVGELGDRGVTAKGNSARDVGFFLKATSSLSGADEPIVLPVNSGRRFDHETELGVIIGRTCRNVRRDQALDYVFGYSCLIDLSMRIEPGRPAEERCTRKSFDSFTPLGPWIVTADEVPDPQSLSNRLWVNGELRQEANTSEMTVGVAELIELISSVMTLRPGDVIASGTPQGVGPVVPGDQVTIEIERVGRMTLNVVAAAEAAPRIF